jgi:hypothetical protein
MLKDSFQYAIRVFQTMAHRAGTILNPAWIFSTAAYFSVSIRFYGTAV